MEIINSERVRLSNIIVNVTIFSNKEKINQGSTSFNKNRTIDAAFKGYFRLKNIKMKSYYIYLEKNNELIELNKNQKISNNLKTGDKLIISDKILNYNEIKPKEIEKLKEIKEKNICSNITFYKDNKFRRDEINNRCTKKQLSAYILPILLIVIIIVIIILITKFLKKKEEEPIDDFEKEILIVNLTRKLDVLYIYENNKSINMKVEMTSIENVISSNQKVDFFIIVKNEFAEKNMEKKTQKYWYSGYIGILNMTINYEEKDWLIMHDKNIEDIINNKKTQIRGNSEESPISCFVKIEFYQNGEIKNIYYPKTKFSSSYIKTIKDYINLLIPKISPQLYTDSIMDSLNEIYHYDDIEDIDISTIRYLENKEPSQEDLSNLEFKEKNYNSNLNQTNLTELFIKQFENSQVSIDSISSIIKKNRTINQEGILVAIEENEEILMDNPKDEEGQDDEEESGEKEDNYYDNDKTENLNNLIDDKKIYIDTINKINLIKSSSNAKIVRSLYRYFNKYSNEFCNETEFNNYLELEMKKRINTFTEGSKNNSLRRIEDNEYYGMKSIINDKPLYKYKWEGIFMEMILFNELDPSTGISSSYFNMTFGKKTIRIEAGEVHSNLHIILEKKNQMIYNLIQLLGQTNNDLKERNRNISAIFIDFENKLLDYFNDNDYSDLFIESLGNINAEYNNLNSDIFSNLIDLINNVYENYMSILKNIKNEKFDIFNNILNTIKDEYINYIYKMLNEIELFENKTLLFLKNIEEELVNYTKIEKVDILYNIMDEIYNCKYLLKLYNKNLFKSINKGIELHKIDINNFIENMLGDLIYITDYLSINIKKNEILGDENIRQELSYKLKNFRNIVITMFELLISNINNDYYKGITIGDNIKSSYEEKTRIFLNKTEEETNNIINKIKEKINDFNSTEIYIDNLDFINNIQNKSIIEFIDNIYKNILTGVKNIEPEYYKEDSEIHLKKNELFDISKSITNEINKEIDEISDYINTYLNNYKKDNISNIQYNIYKINELFLENGMNNLLDKLKKSFKETMEKHKARIDKNYDLGKKVLEDLEELIKEEEVWLSCFYIGKHFDNTFNQYLRNFDNCIKKTYSNDLFNNLRQNYYKIKNEIYNYLKNRLTSIKEYNFGTSVYKEYFSFFGKMKSKILSILNKINQYFNESRFQSLKNELKKNFEKNLNDYGFTKRKELVNYYEKIKNDNKGIYDDDNDFDEYDLIRKRKRWPYLILFFIHKKYVKYNLDNIEDLDKIDLSINDAISYVNDKTSSILVNFRNNANNYLSNYINPIQKVYNEINFYIEDRANKNTNIQNLFNNYSNKYNNILQSNSNFGLLKKLYNNSHNISSDIKYSINILENNLNLFKNYLKDNNFKNNTFLEEYPEEIKFRISNFGDIFKNIIDIIQQNLDVSFRNKITNIIKSTNIFITDMVNFHLEYILTHIKKDNVIQKYYTSKYNFVTNKFKEYSSSFKELTKDIYNINTQNNFLQIKSGQNFMFNEEKFNESVFDILNNLTLFINDYIQKIDNNSINNNNSLIYKNSIFDNNFTYEDNNKSFNSNNSLNETLNNINDSDNNISETKILKYNSNVIKLRTGLYYTKSIIENIMNIFNFNYYEIINIEKQNEKEYMLNDNNINYIYNETQNKLKEINKNSFPVFEQINNTLYKDFISIYELDNDYYPFLKSFEKLLRYQDLSFNVNITNDFSYSLNQIIISLNEYNNTLYKQIQDFKFYNKDNINIYKNKLNNYYNIIENILISYYNNISKMKDSEKFKNCLSNYLSNKQNKKRLLYKESINDIAKNYNLHSLNITFNIGENIENMMKNEYENIEIDNIINYVEIYTKYSNTFFDNILKLISKYKNNILNGIKNINNEFWKYFNSTFTPLNSEYIIELKKNYTNCLNYSIDLLDEIKEEDNINYKKYENYTKIINYIRTNCSSNEINDTRDCLYNISEITKIEFFNKTNYLLLCHNNNYFNQSLKIFDNFEEEKLDNLINNITNIIESNKFDVNYIYNYLENSNRINLYNLSGNGYISNDLKSYNELFSYLNFTQNIIYLEFLNNILTHSFKASYTNYINNYLIDSLIDNLYLFINTKSDFYSNYIINKIETEFNYYVMLFNRTEELDIESINAFFKLYNYTLKHNCEYIYQSLKEDISFYLNVFYAKNKNNFRNNYINYFVNNLNNYNIQIYGLKDFINDIIYDDKFNKTLDIFSKELMNNFIIGKLNITINDLLNNSFERINFAINEKLEKINEILGKINQTEYNLSLNNITMNYQDLVSNQSYRFNFTISNISLSLINSFLKDNLEPPLIDIKNIYNITGTNITERIKTVAENFPDYIPIIKNKLGIDNILIYIESVINEIRDLLLEYFSSLNSDLNNYTNKLIHYTYINKLHTYDETCNDNFCKINMNINQTSHNRFLEDITKIKNIKIVKVDDDIKYNNLKVNKNAKRNLYDKSMDGLSKDDIIPVLEQINSTIFELIEILESNYTKEFENKSSSYITNINGTYLKLLKRTVSISTLKFATVLSDENYQKMESELFNNYYRIEKYIYNITIYLENYVNQLISKIESSSNYFKTLIDLSNTKILGYYDTFIKLIENKFTYISEEDEQEKKRIENYYNEEKTDINDKKKKYFEEKFIQIKNENSEVLKKIFDYFDSTELAISESIVYLFNINIKGIKYYNYDELEINERISSILKDLDYKKSNYNNSLICYNITNLEYSNFNNLEDDNNIKVEFEPNINYTICFNLGFELDAKKKEYKIAIDNSIEMTINTKSIIGYKLNTPLSKNQSEVSFSIFNEIDGNIGSGKVGMKSLISLSEKEPFETNNYQEYYPIEFHVSLKTEEKTIIGFNKDLKSKIHSSRTIKKNFLFGSE